MAELKIFQPEVKKPDGATEKIALSGTTLFYNNFESFPSVGNELLFYFDKSEKILYSWKDGLGYYNISIGINAADDRYVNIDGDTMTGDLTVPNLNVNYLDSTDPEVKSIRINKNVVVNEGEVVIGDGGQVHARGQITTHANRILFASQYDDDLSKEEQFSYSLGLPFTADNHTKNVAAFLPENGGHQATKEYLKNEFCYWSIKKFRCDPSGEWYVHLTVEGKNIDHINLLLCSQSEGWSCPVNADFTVTREDNFITNIHFNGTKFSRLMGESMIGAYNFKELPKLGHIRNVSELSDHTILRHPIYFKFVAVTKNNYKFDSTTMKVTERSDGRYILDIQ